MGVLCDLPDELLANIVRFLNIIRSYETQSTAFKDKNLEKTRQCENSIRQQTLHALSLTSQRLRRVSLPLLYSGSVTSATQSGLRSLQLLHRTLTNPDYALGQPKRLCEHLQYFENRLADHKGNSLQDDDEFQQGPVKIYFQLLADLVMLAPNIEQINIVSLEYDDVSFWTHVIDAPGERHFNSPSTLKYLITQIHAGPTSPDISVSEQSIQHLTSYPMLQEFRMSRAITQRAGSLPLVPAKSLHICRLDLTENSLDIEDVTDLLLACNSVRHFRCDWTFDSAVNVDPSTLHNALLAHANTLETLSLDWREVAFLLSHDANVRLLGSLQPLKVLKSLRISELGFFSTNRPILQFPDMVLDRPLSALLPKSLEHMELLLEATPHPFQHDRLEKTMCLQSLADDCKSSLPHLDALCIKVIGLDKLSVVALTDAFERAGVDLHVHIKPEN
jgi:hypothetical protein